MSTLKKSDGGNILSYLLLRKLIGVMGMLLPFALIFGNYWLGNPYLLQSSISHYYYSYMHIAFVGVLCILGAILISYRENENMLANRVSTFAGYFAFCVTIFPTKCEGFFGPAYIQTSEWESWFMIAHFGSAFLLFVCFAIFCFKIFQKSDQNIEPNQFDSKKRIRNRIYKGCGWGIVISIVLIGVGKIYEMRYGENTFTTYSTFIFETTGLLCFGNSWLLKGSVDWAKSDKKWLRILVAPVR